MAEIQRRLLSDQLDDLVTWLETGEDEPPELFGSSDEDEWLLRLAAVVLSLLHRHRVDGHGRCQWCQETRKGWHRLLPRWKQYTPCRVQRAALFFTRSELDVVWWQVLGLRGDGLSLDDVRAWLRPEESAPEEPQADEPPAWPNADDDYGRHALLTDVRVRLGEADRPDTAKPAAPTVRPYVRREFPTEQFQSRLRRPPRR